MLTLDTRKKQLFSKIVENYISQAEPVSSADLTEPFNLSSATIRNEMAELEKLGLIFQPHTSAGRIPSEAGFKYYVQEFVKEYEPSKKIKEELNEVQQVKDFELALKNLSKKLAHLSQEAVIIAFGRDNLYYTGLSNLLTKPEFTDLRLVIDLGRLVDHLDEVVFQLFNLESETNVMIGQDNPFGSPFGTIIAKYSNPHSDGLLVFLGPMRMAYGQNLGLINYSKKLIGNIHD